MGIGGTASKVGFFEQAWRVILILCIVAILINCGLIYYKTSDFNKVLDYGGSKFVYPTMDLGEQSNKILNNQVAGDSWGNLNYFAVWFFIIEDLILIILWLKVFSWLYLKLILQNESLVFGSYMLAIGTFFMLQVIIMLVKQHSYLEPFNAFVSFFKVIISLVSGPAGNVVNKIMPSYNLTNASNNSIALIGGVNKTIPLIP